MKPSVAWYTVHEPHPEPFGSLPRLGEMGCFELGASCSRQACTWVCPKRLEGLNDVVGLQSFVDPRSRCLPGNDRRGGRCAGAIGPKGDGNRSRFFPAPAGWPVGRSGLGRGRRHLGPASVRAGRPRATQRNVVLLCALRRRKPVRGGEASGQRAGIDCGAADGPGAVGERRRSH